MKIQKALELGCCTLHSETALLDSELLLQKASGLSRETIYAYPERKLSLFSQIRFLYYLHAASHHKPIAYLTGHKEFFGMDFQVNRHVLIPRPDTELLVEEALKILKNNSYLVEIGTGSGCISCAIAKSKQDLQILACDISRRALALAKKNIQRLTLQNTIRLQKADLIVPKIEKADLIIANLPYIRSKDYLALPLTIRKYEPRLALEAGADGLKYYKKLLAQLPNYQGVILIEISDLQQAQELETLFPGFHYEYLKDLSGSIRALKITKKT
ncbi:MAG: peptide chain release factor N(5)-glutamine methyltransferase [Candidatus Gracilibacteria bacterium]|nr:peptide chain release factor N(5)-glutamine methyltransferase [Candidatus Gracilibacteria bacterium]